MLCQRESYLSWSPCCQWVPRTKRWWWMASRPCGRSSCPRRYPLRSRPTVGTDWRCGGPGLRCSSLAHRRRYGGDESVRKAGAGARTLTACMLQCHKPLREIKGCHFRLQLCDVIQVNSIRTKMAASLFYKESVKVMSDLLNVFPWWF